MFRRFIAVAATVLMVGAVGMSEAGAAKPAPVTGTISCSYATGSLALKPGLGTTTGTKDVKVKGTGASGATDTCTGTFTGGKFTISAVTIKISAKIPAASANCIALATAPVMNGKVQVKFWGKNPAGKLATVAVDNTTIASIASAGLSFAITTAPITKGAFVGQTLTVNATAGALTGSCTDADPLTAVAVSGTVTSP